VATGRARRSAGRRLPLVLSVIAAGVLAAAGGVEVSRMLESDDDARPAPAPRIVHATLPATTQTTFVTATTASAVESAQSVETATHSDEATEADSVSGEPPAKSHGKGKGHRKKPHGHGGGDD
jgi:hypothetical protein